MKQMGNAPTATDKISTNAENFGYGVKRVKHICHTTVASCSWVYIQAGTKLAIYLRWCWVFCGQKGRLKI